MTDEVEAEQSTVIINVISSSGIQTGKLIVNGT